MYAKDRRCAANHMLIVPIEHPRVNRESLAEADVMSARVLKLLHATVDNYGESDKVTKASQCSNVTKDRRRGCTQDQRSRFELLSKIVSKAVEETPERGIRLLEGHNTVIVCRSEHHDVAADLSS